MKLVTPVTLISNPKRHEKYPIGIFNAFVATLAAITKARRAYAEANGDKWVSDIYSMMDEMSFLCAGVSKCIVTSKAEVTSQPVHATNCLAFNIALIILDTAKNSVME